MEGQLATEKEKVEKANDELSNVNSQLQAMLALHSEVLKLTEQNAIVLDNLQQSQEAVEKTLECIEVEQNEPERVKMKLKIKEVELSKANARLIHMEKELKTAKAKASNLILLPSNLWS